MERALPERRYGAAVWTGAEMADQALWTWDLSEGEISELLRGEFSDAMLDRISDLRRELTDGRGFQLVRGLSVQGLNLLNTERIFTRFGSLLGSARSQNASGDLLGHVRNVGADSSDPNVRIYQTNRRQTFHTDSADVVGLLCLQTAQSGGDSLLVSAASIYNRMLDEAPDLAAVLFEPIATDRRGEVPPGEKPFFMIPVFNWFDERLTVMYQRQYIESAQRFPDAPRLTERQIRALDLFDQIANDPTVHLTMSLQSGDMQFVHNHGLLHDRTGFVDRPEAPRHLLRLWLSMAGDRELPPIFAERYGSIAIGDRGGIITR